MSAPRSKGLVAALLRIPFRAWRASLGLLLPDSCRFIPTCSRYAEEAVLRRGPVKGLALTVWRLLRCQPLCRGGYDPVIRSDPPCLSEKPG